MRLHPADLDSFTKTNLVRSTAPPPASRRSVELLHPGHGKDLANPIYISWGCIPYNLGSWLSFDWNNQQTLFTGPLVPWSLGPLIPWSLLFSFSRLLPSKPQSE
jgi:hypothetical protein